MGKVKKLSLNEQVAEAKGWEWKEIEEYGLEDEETGEPEIITRETWVDKNGNEVDDRMWSQFIEEAFDLVEEIREDKGVDIHLLTISEKEWMVTINHGLVPRSVSRNKDLNVAICEAYIDYKKRKR